MFPPDLAAAKMPKEGPVPNGRFGAALAGTPRGSGGWDLLVGAPATPRSTERVQAGAAYMFAGSQDRTFPLLEQVFGATVGDHLGQAVAGGLVDNDGIGDLVAVAPGFVQSSALPAGAVYVRLGRDLQRQ